MERDGYNIPKQHCIDTLEYGPIPSKNSVIFLGDNIYKPLENRNIPTNNISCNVDNTFIDCLGRPKFTLPLNDYYKLNYLR